MGQKNLKGTVSIIDAAGRIRLRWRYQGNRYSFNLNEHTKINVLKAKKIALEIEHDILSGEFDPTLTKYKSEKTQELQTKDISSPEIHHRTTVYLSSETVDKIEPGKSIVQHFEEWTRVYRQMDCDKNIDYHSVRSMLQNPIALNQ